MVISIALVQVVTNLVGNALKFTEQGCITLEARSVERGLQFAVHDTGCGMPAEVLGQIFDRFHQVSDNALSRRAGGTGLGLAICKEIIDAHQGRLWAESELSRGTTMTLELPWYVASDVTTVETNKMNQTAKTILVVDDERDVLLMLEKGLAAEGYHVLTADNGRDALTLARVKKPHAIVLDVMLPDLDGGIVANEFGR